MTDKEQHELKLITDAACMINASGLRAGWLRNEIESRGLGVETEINGNAGYLSVMFSDRKEREVLTEGHDAGIWRHKRS